MMKTDPVLRLLAAGLCLAAATPALAVECWDGDDVAAARLQEFQVAMMVTQLRCRATGYDFGQDYQRMMAHNDAALSAATGRLEQHLEGTPEDRQAHLMDDYSTDVGNRYSGERLTYGVCKMFGDVSKELARDASTPDDLMTYAWALVPEPLIEGETCPASPIALAK
jgi:hypothetical protein